MGSYLLAWGDREVSQRAALKALFGEEAISGRLPIPLPPFHAIGEGLDRPKVADFTPPWPWRTRWSPPASSPGPAQRHGRGAAHRGRPRDRGDGPHQARAHGPIIRAALADSAASGAAVAIGRHGRLVKLEGYGELAYGSGRPATPTSIWDLASVSKVVGTTTEAMMLVQQGRLDLDAKVVDYLPWWSRGDARKNEVTVRQLLLHRTGLPAFERWFFDHAGQAGVQGRCRRRAARVGSGHRDRLLRHRHHDAVLDHGVDHRPAAGRLAAGARLRAPRDAGHRVQSGPVAEAPHRRHGDGHALAPRDGVGPRPRRERRRHGRRGGSRRPLLHGGGPVRLRAHDAQRRHRAGVRARRAAGRSVSGGPARPACASSTPRCCTCSPAARTRTPAARSGGTPPRRARPAATTSRTTPSATRASPARPSGWIRTWTSGSSC